MKKNTVDKRDKSPKAVCSTCGSQLRIRQKGEAFMRDGSLMERTGPAVNICPKCGEAEDTVAETKRKELLALCKMLGVDLDSDKLERLREALK